MSPDDNDERPAMTIMMGLRIERCCERRRLILRTRARYLASALSTQHSASLIVVRAGSGNSHVVVSGCASMAQPVSCHVEP
ncbi:hypothetical protein CSHISOI_06265 [Colletotrichum shisoi]|uniref:Uncharacterized protein n=1 Tax=Colletotrichum shisoi TaxID=2078593 RepID=A0A5Q4BQJ4_9PEZI|nr:hypothetical protein CSHISOI_06265 [Colletotrichum shisoi]